MPKEIGLIELTSKSFLDDFKILNNLSNNKIELLAEAINREEEYDIEDNKEIRQLIKKLKISFEQFNSIIKVSDTLHEILYSENIPINDLIIELKNYCKSKKIKGIDNKEDSLKKLLIVKDGYKNKRDRNKYAFATLDTITSISAIQDMRAVFSKDEKSIIEYVPILIIRLFLENDKKEKKYVNFQLTETKLNDLLEKLEKYKEQLVKIKNDFIAKE